MSLYHETAEILSAAGGGSLKSRVFGKKELKSPQAQVYALALESSKWSEVLKEVIENSDILRHERKLTPILALLLAHDFLISKSGIALPQTHGLRAAIERHKARLTSELTRARLKRKMPSLEELKSHIDATADPEGRHPRWIRINTLKTTLEEQLDSTFKDFTRALSVESVVASPKRHIHIDEHIPNLVALSPGTDVTKSEAYKSGAIILQDKASCFPAYLLDPHSGDGNVIDSCAAPGNKTTHLAAIIHEHLPEPFVPGQTILAFERDSKRAQTLEKMVRIAGCKDMTRIGFGQDFLEVDPKDSRYQRVGALLLDPSCSGSGIVGRDFVPELHLPQIAGASSPLSSSNNKTAAKAENRKRKRSEEKEDQILVDDDGNETKVLSEQELQKRLEALSSFQLSLLVHAMSFPAAKKITYSTCSIHAEENEHVVLNALASDVAKERGWHILLKEKQVRGMKEWPVRGSVEACGGDSDISDACIRTYKGDGRGVMGFFVAGFEREPEVTVADVGDGPYLRDEDGGIVRGVDGMPFLQSGAPTGPLAMRMEMEEDASTDEDADDSSDVSSDEVSDGGADEEWNGFDEAPKSAVEMPPPELPGRIRRR